MKVLIAISSCGDFESNGNNQAMRDTWLQDLRRYMWGTVQEPNCRPIDYKFFFGVGQGEPELDDSVILREVPDDYGHLTYKTRASLIWAHREGYDFVFRCFPDTYVRVDRLMACGWEQHDYLGDFRREEGGRTDGGTGEYRPTLQEAQNYASGGAGYWLSRKAFTCLLDQPVTGVWRDTITPYAEDLWVGNRLGKCGITLNYFDDARFVNHGSDFWPKPDNQAITAHMSCPAGRYYKEAMYAAHEIWKLQP